MTKQTTVINFWAGPGVGKSTNTALAYALLKGIEKQTGKQVEIVREYAKELAWTKTKITQEMQNNIYFEQLRREMSLIGLVDYIVTDSPTAIGIFYNAFYNGDAGSLREWESIKRQSVAHADFWCPRLKPYNPEGRYESEEQAKLVDAAMQQFLPNTLGVNPVQLTRVDFAHEVFELAKAGKL